MGHQNNRLLFRAAALSRYRDSQQYKPQEKDITPPPYLFLWLSVVFLLLCALAVLFVEVPSSVWAKGVVWTCRSGTNDACKSAELLIFAHPNVISDLKSDGIVQLDNLSAGSGINAKTSQIQTRLTDSAGIWEMLNQRSISLTSISQPFAIALAKVNFMIPVSLASEGIFDVQIETTSHPLISILLSILTEK